MLRTGPNPLVKSCVGPPGSRPKESPRAPAPMSSTDVGGLRAGWAMRVMPSSVELVRVSHAHFLGAWDPQVRPHVVGERAASWYLRMETLGAQARAGADFNLFI